MPVLDHQVRDCLGIESGSETEKLFLTAPVRWIEAGDDGEMTAVSVGSLNGKQRKEAVATLHSLAVRVMTSSSRHTQRSQAFETAGAPASRPPTHHNRDQQAALPTRPLSKSSFPSHSRTPSYQKPAPQSQAPPIQVIPQSQPPPTRPAPASNATTAPPPAQPAIAAGTLNRSTIPVAQPSLAPAAAPVATGAKEEPSHAYQNGGPPAPEKKLNLPPPPHQIERTETVYMTPPADPSEIPKTLDFS